MRILRLSTLLPPATLLVLASSATASAKEVVINYWGVFSSSEQQEKRIVDEFNRLYRGRIRVIPGPAMTPADLREKLAVAIAAGTAPEVVKFDRFAIAEWAHNGLLHPLDLLITRDRINVKDFYPAAWNEQMFEGRTYGLPWNMDVRAYLFNRAVFAEAGLDPAAPPRTWDEVDQVARKLDRRSGDTFSRAGFLATEGNWFFYGWLLAAGGDITDPTGRKVTWNSEAGRRAARFMVENYTRYGGTPTLTRLKSPGGLYAALADGRIASVVGGSWFIGSLLKAAPEADIGVAPPPRPSELAGTPVSWSGGFSLVIPSTVPPEKKEAAWTFARFFTRKAAVVEVFKGANLGQLPALRSAVLDPAFRQGQPKQLNTFLKILPFSRFRPVIPGGEQLWKVYRDILENKLLNENVPVEQALSETARLGQMVLDQAWLRR